MPPNQANGFKAVTFNDVSPYNITVLVCCSYFVIVGLSIAVIVSIICLFTKSKQSHWKEKMEKRKPLICSVAVVAVFLVVYNFILSAISVWKYVQIYKEHPLYKFDQGLNAGTVSMLIILDSIILLVSIGILVASCCCKDNNTCPWNIVLSFIIFCPILSVIAHSPYIIIAYLNDGHHATSIFIYYTLVIGIGYGLCWVGFHPHSIVRPKRTRQNNAELSNKELACAIFSFCLVIVAYLFLVITITVYFIIIPINKSISDVPDRLAGIYQSGGFVIVSFILYKMITFFYEKSKTTGIEKAIVKWDSALNLREQNNDWRNKPNDEKIDELYEAMLYIITDHYRKVQLNRGRSQSEPAQLRQSEPAQPRQSEPAQPRQSEPAQPRQSEPAQPRQSEPAQPRQSEPAQPRQSEPAQPRQSEPAQPRQSEPAQPRQSEPAQPRQSEPAQPRQSEPAQPRQSEPAQPRQSEPAQPRQSEPAQPRQSEPN